MMKFGGRQGQYGILLLPRKPGPWTEPAGKEAR